MRSMLRITMSTEATNRTMQEERMQGLIDRTTEKLRPEATFFTADGGKRTAYFFFDMKDVTDMCMIAEPWFLATNAEIDIKPVMSRDELQAGLQKFMKAK